VALAGALGCGWLWWKAGGLTGGALGKYQRPMLPR
jgi:hypothetical protein